MDANQQNANHQKERVHFLAGGKQIWTDSQKSEARHSPNNEHKKNMFYFEFLHFPFFRFFVLPLIRLIKTMCLFKWKIPFQDTSTEQIDWKWGDQGKKDFKV